MNSNDKANYYDNLNNSTIKASKRLTNTAINQMPVEANFIQAEAPQDYDGIFDKAVDLYNSLIIHSKEIYQYFNENPEFYPKDSKQGIYNKVNNFQLSGAGMRRNRKHRLKGGFNRLLNAEKTPRYTEYMMGKQYPIRSKLFGGILHGGVGTPPESSSDEEEAPAGQPAPAVEPAVNQYIRHPYLAVLKKAQLLFLLNTYYSTDGFGVPHENYTRKNENDLRIMLSNIPTDWTQPQYAITLTRAQITKLGRNGPPPPRRRRAPREQPQALDVQAIDDGQPPDQEPDPNQPLDIDNVALAKSYNFELNPILGIVNKILLTIKNLYRYEKYLLQNYEFIKPEDGETLKNIYNELCQNFVYILHIVEYFEENNATMDNELNYKTMDALRQLLNNYKQVITNLINILEAKNFDITVVQEVENYLPDDDLGFNDFLKNLKFDVNDDEVPPEARDLFGLESESDNEGGPAEEAEIQVQREAFVRANVDAIRQEADNLVRDINEHEHDEQLLHDIYEETSAFNNGLDNFLQSDINNIEELRNMQEFYKRRIDEIYNDYLGRNAQREQIENIIFRFENRDTSPAYEDFEADEQFKHDIDLLDKSINRDVLNYKHQADERNYSLEEQLHDLQELERNYKEIVNRLVEESKARNTLELPAVPVPKKRGRPPGSKTKGGAMHHIEKQMEYQKKYPEKGMLYQHRNPAYRRDNILELINKYPVNQLDNLTKYLL